MEDPGTAIPLEKLVAHREWVRRVARALVRDESLADDLEQDVWLEALTRPPRSGRSLGGWLAAAMRHNLLDYRRSEGRRRVREEAVARPEAAKSAADVVGEAETLKRVVDAVLELEEPYKGTLLLRYFEDLPLQEVARRQDIPLETVRTRLRRGLRLLRERFDRESDGDRKAWCLALLPLVGKPGTAVSAGAATGAAVAGGLLMTGKAVAAGVAVLALGLVGWYFLRSQEPPPSRPLTAADRVEPRPAPVPVVALSSAPTAASDSVPLPVDLAKCDRDLDLFGTVVDAAGLPVPGARLEVLQDPRRGSPLLALFAEFTPRIDGTTSSATDGTFRFRLSRGAVRNLRAVAPGFAETLLPNCLAGERLRVTLYRGGTIVVITRNAKQEPVEGAFVRIRRSVSGAEPVLDRAGTTGSDGRCTFESLVPGRIEFTITHPRYAAPEGSFSAVPRDGVRTLEFVLTAAATVYGTVRDATTRAPLAGARVGPSWEPHLVFLTDEEGRFAYPGWRPVGTPWLQVEATGYSAGWAKVSPGTAAEVLLSPEDILEGRVIDARGGPVDGAFVTVVGKLSSGPRVEGDFDPRRSTSTGPDGRFRVRGLRHDRTHFLQVRAEGFGLLFREVSPAPWTAGTISLGDLSLAGAASLEGTLSDAKGKPLAGVPVQLEGPLGDVPEGMESMLRSELRTDDLGRFRFHQLAAGRYRVGSLGDRYGPGAVTVEVNLGDGEEARGIDLRLASDGSLSVVVVDPSGTPVPGANVYATAPDQKWRMSRWAEADGRTTFTGLPPGKVCLQAGVFSSGGLPLTVSERTQPMDADGSEATLTLRSTGVVKGKVVDANGNPLEGLEVRATSGTGSWGWQYVTDSEGQFTFDAPMGDPINLMIGAFWKDRRDPSTRGPTKLRAVLDKVPVPSENVLLRVGAPDLRSLTIRLVDPEGNPVAGIRVLEWLHSPPASVTTGTDGRARFEGLLPEESRFGVFPGKFPEGCVMPSAVNAVPDGQEVLVTLRRGVPFTGTVLRANGTPAAGAQLSADYDDGTASVGTADSEGKFRIFVVPGVHLKSVSAMWGTDERTGEVAHLRDVDPEAGPVVLRLEPVQK